MLVKAIAFLITLVLALPLGGEQRPDAQDESRRIALTLDALHAAAAKADGAAYFQLFAPDAVFLGTDAT